MNCSFCGKDMYMYGQDGHSCWDCGITCNGGVMRVRKLDKKGDWYWKKVPMGCLVVLAGWSIDV